MMLAAFLAHISRKIWRSLLPRQVPSSVRSQFHTTSPLKPLSPYMVKTLTIFFSRIKKTDGVDTWCAALRMQVLARVGRKPSDTDSIKSQISPKTSRGKKDSTKDAIKDITSDSQVNSYFSYRWSPASLTINIYFT